MYELGMMRAGQSESASWSKPILSADGEQKRTSEVGVLFNCKEMMPGQTSKSFRDAIEAKTYSCIIATTNPMVKGIESMGGAVVYKKARRQVQYATYDSARKIYTIALK